MSIVESAPINLKISFNLSFLLLKLAVFFFFAKKIWYGVEAMHTFYFRAAIFEIPEQSGRIDRIVGLELIPAQRQSVSPTTG